MTPREAEPFTDWTAATAAGIRAAPGVRLLADASGISAGELSRIAGGTRSATKRVGVAVARGLVKLAKEQARAAASCERHAGALKRALGRQS